jgi:CPA2 family monovalent cation:H+ antiporter-2
MLFDPRMLIEEPLRILVVVAIIIIGKTVAAFAIVIAFRYPLNTALTVSASLAQIGEFSFILASLGVALKLMPPEGQNLILAGAVISIALNPLVFSAIEPLQKWIRSKSGLARAMERGDDPLAQLPMSTDHKLLTGHVLIVGYGRVGRRICDSLLQRGIPVVVAEQNREAVEQLRRNGIAAVSGDAAEPGVLIQAHVARAAILVIATPDTPRARKMMETARMLNPGIDIIVRTHSDEEADLLRKEKADHVFMGEHELAQGMTRHILERVAASEAGKPAAGASTKPAADMA